MEVTPEVGADPEGLAGLRAAASESIDFIAAMVEQGENWTPSLAPAVAAHVRYLARNEVTLDAAMESYIAFISVCMEFLTAEVGQLPPDTLRYLLRMQSQHSEKVMRAYSIEYMNEVKRLNRSPAQRLERQVRRLLGGGSVDAANCEYDFDSWNLGFVAVGPKADLVMRRLAEKLGCRLLLVPRAYDEPSWAWLGATRRISFGELERLVSAGTASVSLAVGEPRRGIAGWRLTHREALVALGVMLRRPQLLTRGSDVILTAAVAQDSVMSRCLVDTYLGPMDERKDGSILRETLRSYFDLDCNAASTAAALRVDRHTVQRRLRRIEECIGRPLSICRTELEIALRVSRLDGGPAQPAVD